MKDLRIYVEGRGMTTKLLNGLKGHQHSNLKNALEMVETVRKKYTIRTPQLEHPQYVIRNMAPNYYSHIIAIVNSTGEVWVNPEFEN